MIVAHKERTIVLVFMRLVFPLKIEKRVENEIIYTIRSKILWIE